VTVRSAGVRSRLHGHEPRRHAAVRRSADLNALGAALTSLVAPVTDAIRRDLGLGIRGEGIAPEPTPTMFGEPGGILR